MTDGEIDADMSAAVNEGQLAGKNRDGNEGRALTEESEISWSGQDLLYARLRRAPYLAQ